MLPMTLLAAVVLTTPAPVAYPVSFQNISVREAQTKALAISPDVAAAQARARQAQAFLSATLGTLGPAAFVSYSQAPQAGTMGETISQRLTTMGVQTTVNDLLARTPQVLAAQASYNAARSDLLSAQAAERTKTLGIYYDALRADATLEVRRAALRVAEEDRGAARVRFSAGDAPRLDVTRAEVAVAQATAALATADSAAANAREALAVETGTAPGALVTSVQLGDNAPVPDPQTALRRALESRPEIASAQAAVRAERSAMRGAQLGVLPQLTASAGYTNGTDSGQAIHGPSVSLQATIPLSAAAASRVRLEQARVDEAQAKLEGVQRQVTLEVAASVRTYAADVRAAGAAKEARRAAAIELRATQTGYRSGASSSLDVAAARQTYDQAVLDEIAAYYAVIAARATVFTLMGAV